MTNKNMGLATLLTPFPWYRYSKKLLAKMDKWRCAGFFTSEESLARDMQLIIGESGKLEDGHLVKLYWLVDKDDGIIVDAKFQAFGLSALLLAAEVTCSLLIGKNYDQARRITAVLIDQQARDRSDVPAFPPETAPYLNFILEAIEHASQQCTGIPLASNYSSPPAHVDITETRPGGYPGWQELSKDQKLVLIEEVLNQEVRPYIALDAGGVIVLDLIGGQELLIAYEGSCTSCYSSVGATLSFIQQILKAKLHPALTVTPNLHFDH